MGHFDQNPCSRVGAEFSHLSPLYREDIENSSKVPKLGALTVKTPEKRRSVSSNNHRHHHDQNVFSASLLGLIPRLLSPEGLLKSTFAEWSLLQSEPHFFCFWPYKMWQNDVVQNFLKSTLFFPSTNTIELTFEVRTSGTRCDKDVGRLHGKPIRVRQAELARR